MYKNYLTSSMLHLGVDNIYTKILKIKDNEHLKKLKKYLQLNI